MTAPLIGILGGMGPQAGLDMASKIVAETIAEKDQDHVPVVLFSLPQQILNRTEFLLAEHMDSENPAVELGRQIQKMASIGVTVVGMACNTAHAAPIFDALMEAKNRLAPKVKLLHLIEETVHFIVNELPDVSRVGVLATSGTYRFRLYDDLLETAGLSVLRPSVHIASHSLQEAINNPEWGIKSVSNPVSAQSRRLLKEAVDDLHGQGAEAIILGCTELPLAVTREPGNTLAQPEANTPGGIGAAKQPVLVDPTRVLARALIRYTYPEKLISSWPD